MGEVESKVRFTEEGSTGVISAFKNIGSNAKGTAQQVSSGTSAVKQFGMTAKNSAQGIVTAATAFATLSLSVVSTWRAYRDLGDAQLAVDKSQTKLDKSIEKLNKMKAASKQLSKEEGKGSLEYNGILLDLKEARDKEAKAIHESGKKSLAAAQAHQTVLEIQAKLTKGGGKYEQALKDIAIQEDVVANNTWGLSEAQESFNDTQQNFYLSLLPTALSGFAALSSAMTGFKGILGGGVGGLTGMLGPLGIGIAGISAGLYIWQTNMFGIQDAVKGFIPVVKQWATEAKDTVAAAFEKLKAGDIEGALNIIKDGLTKWWANVKKAVPFFGGLELLATQIAGRNWEGAFETIKTAAVTFWTKLKQAVPIFGKLEDIITAISEAKWGDAFQGIVDIAQETFNNTLGKGIEWIFGKNWKSGLDAKVAEITAEASVHNRSVPVEIGIEANAAITKLTGFDVAKWIKEHPITASIPMFGGITMMIEDAKWRKSFMDGASLIIAKLGEAITDIAGLLDPYIAGLFKSENWIAALNSTVDELKKIGEAIWKWIFGGIQDGFQGQDWTKLLFDFERWSKKTIPETVQTLKERVGAPGPLQKAREAGFELNPLVPDNAWTRFAHDMQVRLGIIDPKVEVTPKLSADAPQVIQNGVNATGQRGQYKVPILPDTSGMPPVLAGQLLKVLPKNTKLAIGGNTTGAIQEADKARKNIDNMKATIKVGVQYSTKNIGGGGAKGYVPGYVGPKKFAQHGMHERLRKDTLIYAHKNEEVHIDKPEKMQKTVSHGKAGGGGGGMMFPSKVILQVGQMEFDAYIRAAAYEDQGVQK